MLILSAPVFVPYLLDALHLEPPEATTSHSTRIVIEESDLFLPNLISRSLSILPSGSALTVKSL